LKNGKENQETEVTLDAVGLGGGGTRLETKKRGDQHKGHKTTGLPIRIGETSKNSVKGGGGEKSRKTRGKIKQT